MSCRKWQAQISAFLDGELKERHADRVRAHLDQCAHCAARRREYEQARAALRALPAPEVRAGAWERLRRELPAPPTVRFPQRPRLLWQPALALASTVAVLLFAAVWVRHLPEGGQVGEPGPDTKVDGMEIAKAPTLASPVEGARGEWSGQAAAPSVELPGGKQEAPVPEATEGQKAGENGRRAVAPASSLPADRVSVLRPEKRRLPPRPAVPQPAPREELRLAAVPAVPDAVPASAVARQEEPTPAAPVSSAGPDRPGTRAAKVGGETLRPVPTEPRMAWVEAAPPAGAGGAGTRSVAATTRRMAEGEAMSLRSEGLAGAAGPTPTRAAYSRVERDATRAVERLSVHDDERGVYVEAVREDRVTPEATVSHTLVAVAERTPVPDPDTGALTYVTSVPEATAVLIASARQGF